MRSLCIIAISDGRNISCDLLLQQGEYIFDWLVQIVRTQGVLILIVLWKCWNMRNKLIFDGIVIPQNVVVAQVWGLYYDTVKAFGVDNVTTQINTIPKEVKWQKPLPGWIALNVDGNAVTNLGLVGFGEFIRDHDGRFLRSFYGSIGI